MRLLLWRCDNSNKIWKIRNIWTPCFLSQFELYGTWCWSLEFEIYKVWQTWNSDEVEILVAIFLWNLTVVSSHINQNIHFFSLDLSCTCVHNKIMKRLALNLRYIENYHKYMGQIQREHWIPPLHYSSHLWALCSCAQQPHHLSYPPYSP